MTTNEAAERLLGDPGDPAANQRLADIKAIRAAERRATVERIRAAVERVHRPQPAPLWLLAILDEEAAR